MKNALKRNENRGEMKSMYRRDLKVVLIGLLISCVLMRSIVFPIVHILLSILMPNLAFEIMEFILMMRLAVFSGGCYVGVSKAQNKIITSSITGVLYFPFATLISLTVFNKHLDVNSTVILGIMMDGLVSVLGTMIGKSIRRLSGRSE